MSYYRHIDNGDGPTKLFVGGVHGNEGRTSIKFLEKLKKSDFAPGQIYLYNFDKSPYISTLDEKYFHSKMGKTILDLITEINPDFYFELHCYNIKNFEKLTSMERLDTVGVPPLIGMGNYVLIGSISPVIRTKYFSMNDVCKTLEMPCLDKIDDETADKYNFDLDSTFNRFDDILKAAARAPNREAYEKEILGKYPAQVELAISFAQIAFGKYFPPY